MTCGECRGMFVCENHRRERLLATLGAAGVELDARDVRLVDWIVGWDTQTVAWFQSIIERSNAKALKRMHDARDAACSVASRLAWRADDVDRGEVLAHLEKLQRIGEPPQAPQCEQEGCGTRCELVADHDGQLVGLLLAQPDPAHQTYNLLDLRVDFDFRRQGLGLAFLYQLLSTARDAELRAVRAETPANNYPAIQLLRKTSFELAGLDTFRHSNHDLVKEQVTLLWYAPLA